MAEVNTSATTTPKTSMKTELSYATTSSGSYTQIFMVQSIPALQSVKDPINYGALESSTEFSTAGTRKAEQISIPILYVADQHTALKALADAGTKVYFKVTLPSDTAPSSGTALTLTFSGTIDLILDELTIDGMITETLTIYKDSFVTEA